MQFFEQQDRAKGRTTSLVLLFALSILILTALMYVSLAYLITLKTPEVGKPIPSMWNPQLLLWVVLGNGLVIGLGSLSKIIELRGGGDRVAEMLGGRLIHCLLYTSPSPRDATLSRMPSSA